MTRVSSVRVKAAVGMAATALVLLALSAAGHALTGSPVTLEGAVSCDESTGKQVVTWTLSNPSGTSVTIDSAAVDDSGMSTGGALEATATLSPNPVANGGTATGTTQVSGDGTGDLHLIVTYTYADEDPEVDGEVVMPGGCLQAETTTTTTATTSTTSDVAATTAAAPRFTG